MFRSDFSGACSEKREQPVFVVRREPYQHKDRFYNEDEGLQTRQAQGMQIKEQRKIRASELEAVMAAWPGFVVLR